MFLSEDLQPHRGGKFDMLSIPVPLPVAQEPQEVADVCIMKTEQQIFQLRLIFSVSEMLLNILFDFVLHNFCEWHHHPA